MTKIVQWFYFLIVGFIDYPIYLSNFALVMLGHVTVVPDTSPNWSIIGHKNLLFTWYQTQTLVMSLDLGRYDKLQQILFEYFDKQVFKWWVLANLCLSWVFKYSFRIKVTFHLSVCRVIFMDTHQKSGRPSALYEQEGVYIF